MGCAILPSGMGGMWPDPSSWLWRLPDIWSGPPWHQTITWSSVCLPPSVATTLFFALVKSASVTQVSEKTTVARWACTGLIKFSHSLIGLPIKPHMGKIPWIYIL